MPMRSERVGYCDVCTLEIRGVRKGWCFTGRVDVLNNPTRTSPIANLGVKDPTTNHVDNREVVLCQECFEEKFAPTDTVNQDGTIQKKQTRFGRVVNK